MLLCGCGEDNSSRCKQQLIDLDYIQAFDPTKYTYQYDAEEFCLPTVHNRWVPVSCVLYSVDGDILESEMYSVTSSGELIYITKTGDIGYPRITRKDVSYLNNEVYRNALTTRCYYEGQASGESNELCGYVCVRELGDADATGSASSVPCGYEIISFGQYDFASHLRVEYPRYMETDENGTLEMIVVSASFGYWAYWFDEFGRKSWYAGYDLEGELYEYAIYEYEEV